MKTYVCHKCPGRVCVSAIDEEAESDPMFCTKDPKNNPQWHAVKEQENEKKTDFR